VLVKVYVINVKNVSNVINLTRVKEVPFQLFNV